MLLRLFYVLQPNMNRNAICVFSTIGWLNNLNHILNFVVPRPLHDCQKIQQDDTRESIIG